MYASGRPNGRQILSNGDSPGPFGFTLRFAQMMGQGESDPTDGSEGSIFAPSFGGHASMPPRRRRSWLHLAKQTRRALGAFARVLRAAGNPAPDRLSGTRHRRPPSDCFRYASSSIPRLGENVKARKGKKEHGRKKGNHHIMPVFIALNAGFCGIFEVCPGRGSNPHDLTVNGF